MNATLVTFGFWRTPIAVKHCLCPDGIRRRARVTGQADTYFSIPASVTVKGVTVSGFVTGRDNEGQQDYVFIPYTYRKNHAVFTANKEG